MTCSSFGRTCSLWNRPLFTRISTARIPKRCIVWSGPGKQARSLGRSGCLSTLSAPPRGSAVW
ncbi:UNVERIFIED_CONTAM: hypothetical protein GTU68_024555 [Idotea baltica]|nr:hypothetical protein [Idotea baltica]